MNKGQTCRIASIIASISIGQIVQTGIGISSRMKQLMCEPPILARSDKVEHERIQHADCKSKVFAMSAVARRRGRERYGPQGNP